MGRQLLGGGLLSSTPTAVVSLLNTGSALFHHTVPITLSAAQVPRFTSYDAVRFNGADGSRLASWKQVETEVDATYWVRVPSLPTGVTTIYAVASSAAQTSFAPQLTAAAGTKLTLTTAVLDTNGNSMATVHPKAIVTQGWAAKAADGGADVYDRVLLDTAWTAYPPVGHNAGEYENPALWVRKAADSSWVWPTEPEGGASPPGFPGTGNEIVVKPEGVGAYNTDPTMVWVPAHSLPGGGPEVDSLFIWWRPVNAPIRIEHCVLTGESWASMVKSAQAVCTGITEPTGEQNYISPSVVQLPDGSLRMWCLTRLNVTKEQVITMYRSDDGAAWTLVGDATPKLPGGLWGPYHQDVIYAGGVYWHAGTYQTQRVAADEGTISYRTLYLAKSVDGQNWELIFPAGLRAGALGTWNEAGPYRPSMLYLGAGGMEFYVGSSQVEIPGATRGGTGLYIDSTWSPTVPRALTEPITGVFRNAREFVEAADVWPLPLYTSSGGGGGGTATVADGELSLATAVAAGSQVIASAHGYRPRDFEMQARAKIAGSHALFVGVSSNELWLDPFQAVDLQLRHNGTSVLKMNVPPTPEQYHTYRVNRVGDVTQAFADGVALDAAGDGSGATTAATAGQTELEAIVLSAKNRSAVAATANVDWFFFRDAVAEEPSVTVGA